MKKPLSNDFACAVEAKMSFNTLIVILINQVANLYMQICDLIHWNNKFTKQNVCKA